MAMGTSHSPTETIVEAFKGTQYDTGLDIVALLEIAAYFREVRKKYAKFESSFLGADTRILASQVPGGMLSNLESQLKEQGAANQIDDVLKEIAIVQKDCGYIPLVTPTSQIVGTQAVFNVLFGRYEKLTAETADLVTGRYGALAAPANPDLVKKALAQNKYDEVLTCRPADKIPNEYAKIADEAKAAGAGNDEDILTYAMFPKVAPKFFKERVNGPVSSDSFAVPKAAVASAGGSYTVNVNGTAYNVTAGPSGDTMSINVNGTAYNVAFGASSAPQNSQATTVAPAAVSAASAAPVASGGAGADITAPVAGTLLKHLAPAGSVVKTGQTILLIESMKMELEIKATIDGPVSYSVAPGSQIAAGQVLGRIGGGASAAPVQAAPVAPAPVQAVPVVAAPVAPAPVAAAQAPSGEGVVVQAPVAGTLLKNVLAEGTAVEPGKTIIIIESMKMELEIKAASSGAVHYLTAPGSQISAGQPLAEIK
jgi:oxaloacetate decarboxylase alpha subunit